MMVTIQVPIPSALKAKLDALRAQGYTINGFVRATLAKALADPPARPGPVRLRYRKPGCAWRSRVVKANQLEATVLKLEDQGAEILYPS